jgi:hypothetical protein
MPRRTLAARTGVRDAAGTFHRPAMSRPHSVRLDPDLERQLQAAAARAGVSASDFIRQAVAERIERVLGTTSLWERLEPILQDLPTTGETTDVASRTHAAFEELLVSRRRATDATWSTQPE